jgi:phosphate-selective porin OprO and OprP
VRLIRHALWLIVTAAGLTGLAANAQTPQQPPTPPGSQDAPVYVLPRDPRYLWDVIPPSRTDSPTDRAPHPIVGIRWNCDGGVIPLEPPQEDRKVGLSAAWQDGLRFNSADDAFHIHVGGSAQIDSNWLIAPQGAFELPNNGGTSGVGNSSATFLRRVRLRVEGDIYDQFDFMVEYDFANAENDTGSDQPPSFSNINGAPSPTNVWMQVRDVPVLGDVRVGLQRKPLGFMTQVSQAYLPFMERPDVYDAFQGTDDSGSAIGVSFRNHTDDARITWQYGVYRPLVNVFGIALNKMDWGGRVTALPIYEDDGEVLVHVGLGTLNGELPQNELKVRARPLLRNGPGYAVPILVNTGDIEGNRQYTIAPEFAAVVGPWTFLAEWDGQWLTQAKSSDGTDQGTVLYHGGYAEILYFLTGERQSYDKAAGAFGRVVPNTNLRMKRGEGISGLGAWQLGVCFSYLDLDDKAIQGGRLWDCTVGLNWYWNPNMKVQFNYIVERRDQPDVPPVWINGVGVRAAYDF